MKQLEIFPLSAYEYPNMWVHDFSPFCLREEEETLHLSQKKKEDNIVSLE